MSYFKTICDILANRKYNTCMQFLLIFICLVYYHILINAYIKKFSIDILMNVGLNL